MATTPEVFTLALVPERPQYPEGSALPDFKATIKNATTKPQKICTYMLRYRLMLAMVAKDAQGLDYGLYPFHPGRFEPWKNDDLRTLAPGELVTETLTLSRAEGWGFVRTGDQPPMILPRHAVRGFPAGATTFSTLLWANMAIYSGADGQYDGNLTSRRVPEDIPGAKNAADLFKGDLRATATVKFGRR